MGRRAIVVYMLYDSFWPALLLVNTLYNFYNIIANAVTLAGINSEPFKGFLILSVNDANERVGSFAPIDVGQTACDVSTH